MHIDHDRLEGRFQEMSLDEFEELFAQNEIRRDVFNQFMQFAQDMGEIVEEEFVQFIDGSYTTDKEEPNDVDIVTVLPFYPHGGRMDKLLQFQREGGVDEKYDMKVDSYLLLIYPNNDQRNNNFYSKLNDKLEFYSTDRNPKDIYILRFNQEEDEV